MLQLHKQLPVLVRRGRVHQQDLVNGHDRLLLAAGVEERIGNGIELRHGILDPTGLLVLLGQSPFENEIVRAVLLKFFNKFDALSLRGCRIGEKRDSFRARHTPGLAGQVAG